MTEQLHNAFEAPLGSSLPEWVTEPAPSTNEAPKDDNRGAPGALRGDVTVKLHTREAYRLFTGLDPRTHEKTKGARSSLFSFEKSCQNIELAIQHDDPYADYYFYHLHQRINETHAALKSELEQFSNWLRGKLPESISYTESTSLKPTILPVRAKTKLFFLVLYLALDVDKYCRMIYLACHFALIPKSTQSQLIYDKLNAVRSITEEANKFRHTEANRDDFAANNARARAAIEKHKFTLKEEFLRGDTRSVLAPDITRRPENDQQGKATVENDVNKMNDDPLLQVVSTNTETTNEQATQEQTPKEPVTQEQAPQGQAPKEQVTQEQVTDMEGRSEETEFTNSPTSQQ